MIRDKSQHKLPILHLRQKKIFFDVKPSIWTSVFETENKTTKKTDGISCDFFAQNSAINRQTTVRHLHKSWVRTNSQFFQNYSSLSVLH